MATHSLEGIFCHISQLPRPYFFLKGSFALFSWTGIKSSLIIFLVLLIVTLTLFDNNVIFQGTAISSYCGAISFDRWNPEYRESQNGNHFSDSPSTTGEGETFYPRENAATHQSHLSALDEAHDTGSRPCKRCSCYQ